LRIQHVVLQQFRNHTHTALDCSPGINVFLGKNGEGKTNVLEGISYLCLSKSFFTASDGTVVQIGAPGFISNGVTVSDSGIEYRLRVEYHREKNSKSVFVNSGRIEKASALIGMFPLVVLSPDQHTITVGSPADRRKFLDLVVSQSNRLYLEHLIEYRRILKQRNKILVEYKTRREDPQEELEPWNESLVQAGVLVMQKRIEFIQNFQPFIQQAYAQIARLDEKPTIQYIPSFSFEGTHDIQNMVTAFHKALREKIRDERFSGHTQVGPHRDELYFSLNDLDMRGYASQGQHKTMLVAVKLAEFFFLRAQCNETPILLLDDVLSELDMFRSQRLLEATADLGQIFMTSTDERALDWLPVAKAAPRKFFIQQGSIERIEETVH
jgi:DNA replication and repair protein RecF